MKYFITEDRISGMIKKTLKEKFPSIYDINIEIVNVQLGADGLICMFYVAIDLSKKK